MAISTPPGHSFCNAATGSCSPAEMAWLGSQLLSHAQPFGTDVDGHDGLRAGQPRSGDGTQTDAAGPKHGHALAGADAGRVQHRPDARGHGASEQRGVAEVELGRQHGDAVLADHRMAGERRDAAGIHGPAVPRVDRARHVGPGALDPRERHTVAGPALGHPRPDLLHGPAALVAQAVRQSTGLGRDTLGTPAIACGRRPQRRSRPTPAPVSNRGTPVRRAPAAAPLVPAPPRWFSFDCTSRRGNLSFDRTDVRSGSVR